MVCKASVSVRDDNQKVKELLLLGDSSLAQYLFDLVSVDLVVSLNGNFPMENGKLLSSLRLCQV